MEPASCRSLKRKTLPTLLGCDHIFSKENVLSSSSSVGGLDVSGGAVQTVRYQPQRSRYSTRTSHSSCQSTGASARLSREAISATPGRQAEPLTPQADVQTFLFPPGRQRNVPPRLTKSSPSSRGSPGSSTPLRLLLYFVHFFFSFLSINAEVLHRRGIYRSSGQRG